MPKKYTFLLDGVVYPSKTAVLQKYRALCKLAKQSGHCPYVINKGDSNFQFIRDLVDLHPNPDKHFETSHFEMKLDGQRGHWCGWIVGIDGREESFSPKSCMETSREKVDKCSLDNALRFAIKNQRDAFKAEFGSVVKCSDCHIKMEKNKMNADHDVTVGPSFKEIADEFLQELGPIALKTRKRRFDELVDKKIEAKWKVHHQQRANFRWLCTLCNNQTKNKKSKK